MTRWNPQCWIHKPQQILVRLRGEEDIIWLCNIGSIPIYVKSATRLKHDGGKKIISLLWEAFRVYFFITGFPLSYRFPVYRYIGDRGIEVCDRAARSVV